MKPILPNCLSPSFPSTLPTHLRTCLTTNQHSLTDGDVDTSPAQCRRMPLAAAAVLAPGPEQLETPSEEAAQTSNHDLLGPPSDLLGSLSLGSSSSWDLICSPPAWPPRSCFFIIKWGGRRAMGGSHNSIVGNFHGGGKDLLATLQTPLLKKLPNPNGWTGPAAVLADAGAAHG